MRRVGVLVTVRVGAAILSSLAACSPGARAPETAAPACPRDAHVDPRGRCACDPGDVLVLGACVPPAVADVYCGPVGHALASGACVFPTCAADEAVDVDAGCIPLRALLNGGPRSCDAGTSLVAEDGRLVCIPSPAACPRGTRAEGNACLHAPGCPAGSLLAGGASCRPLVFEGPAGTRRVDVGAWAALVLGVDGGPGSEELCRALESHPLASGAAHGEEREREVRLRIALTFPDGDVARVSGEVATHTAAQLAERALSTLLEPLRGLGGVAIAGRVDVEVRCREGLPGRP